MRIPVVPFLTPPTTAVKHGGWYLRAPDGINSALPKDIPHWDYQTTLELTATLSVDRDTVTQACQLDRDSVLNVVVLATSDHTRIQIPAARVEVPLTSPVDLPIEVRLHGSDLGGRLTLETVLVAVSPKPDGALSPARPGSILWRERHWTNLEGVGSQFPTESVDFKASGRDERAGWELRIDLSDPDARFMSAVRLIMNSGHPSIAKLLRGELGEDTEQLLRTVHWDVTRQMVYTAIRSDDVAALELDPEALSVAGVLRNLVAVVFPTENIVTLRKWLDSEPERIELRLQHHCGLLP